MSYRGNQIQSGGKSRIVRTLSEFSKQCGLSPVQLAAIAMHHPLPKPAFIISTRGRDVKHYEKADLEKWLSSWSGKNATN